MNIAKGSTHTYIHTYALAMSAQIDNHNLRSLNFKDSDDETANIVGFIPSKKTLISEY